MHCGCVPSGSTEIGRPSEALDFRATAVHSRVGRRWAQHHSCSTVRGTGLAPIVVRWNQSSYRRPDAMSTVVIIMLVLVLLVVIWLMGTYNRLVVARNRFE